MGVGCCSKDLLSRLTQHLLLLFVHFVLLSIYVCWSRNGRESRFNARISKARVNVYSIDVMYLFFSWRMVLISATFTSRSQQTNNVTVHCCHNHRKTLTALIVSDGADRDFAAQDRSCTNCTGFLPSQRRLSVPATLVLIDNRQYEDTYPAMHCSVRCRREHQQRRN